MPARRASAKAISTAQSPGRGSRIWPSSPPGAGGSAMAIGRAGRPPRAPAPPPRRPVAEPRADDDFADDDFADDPWDDAGEDAAAAFSRRAASAPRWALLRAARRSLESRRLSGTPATVGPQADPGRPGPDLA